MPMGTDAGCRQEDVQGWVWWKGSAMEQKRGKGINLRRLAAGGMLRRQKVFESTQLTEHKTHSKMLGKKVI